MTQNVQAGFLWSQNGILCGPLWSGVSEGYPGVEVSILLWRKVNLDGVYELGPKVLEM